MGRADGGLKQPLYSIFFALRRPPAVRRQSVRKALLRTMFTVSRSVFTLSLPKKANLTERSLAWPTAGRRPRRKYASFWGGRSRFKECLCGLT